MLIQKASLSETLDTWNEAQFFGKKPSAAERKELALWLAGRQGMPGSYAEGTMFAPTAKDFKYGHRTFTGEKITSGAATSNQLGEETIRALLLLDVKVKHVQDALNAALTGKATNLDWPERPQGWHCCGSCSVALWRRWVAAGTAEREISAGLMILKEHRDDKGRYRRFPFWYTMLALSELGHKAALTEISYAAPWLERVLKRQPKNEKYDQRRHVIAERCLAKV